MADAGSNTISLVEQWIKTRQHVDRLRGELNRAETERLNTANALAAHLWPKGATESEQFGIWVHDSSTDGDRLLIVRRKNASFTIEWYDKIPKAQAQAAKEV